jgi:integrase
VALATTGIRIGELYHLRVSDIDLGTGMSTLKDNRHSAKRNKGGTAQRTTKNRQTRRVPFIRL